MLFNEYKLKTVFVGRLNSGDDLFESLSKFCEEKNIKCAHISLIGAVKNIKLGYYKQIEKQYIELDSLSDKGPFEITSCSGNVSLKDDKPALHLHIIVCDKEGKCFGGHLIKGVEVFACEFVISVFEGEPLNRGIDKTTGLPLWE